MDNYLNKKHFRPHVDKAIKRIFELEEDSKIDGVLLKSIYDTPIIYPIKFNAGWYYYKHKPAERKPAFFNNKSLQDFHNAVMQSGWAERKQMADFILPPTAIADFHREKIVTKTNTLSGNGTIKEIWGFSDWDITIRILCIKERTRTAQQSRDLIIEWANLLDIIDVSGEIFTSKGIHAIVIENIDIKTIAGSPDVIPIELKCVSAEPLLMLIQEPENRNFFHSERLQNLDNILNDAQNERL